MKGDPRFHAELKKLGDLHDLKQRDYGTDDDPFANVRSSANFGVEPWRGALVRMGDKVTRLQQYAKRGTLSNESFEDSLYDLAVYAIICLILKRETEMKQCPDCQWVENAQGDIIEYIYCEKHRG